MDQTKTEQPKKEEVTWITRAMSLSMRTRKDLCNCQPPMSTLTTYAKCLNPSLPHGLAYETEFVQLCNIIVECDKDAEFAMIFCEMVQEWKRDSDEKLIHFLQTRYPKEKVISSSKCEYIQKEKEMETEFTSEFDGFQRLFDELVIRSQPQKPLQINLKIRDGKEVHQFCWSDDKDKTWKSKQRRLTTHLDTVD